MMQQASMGTQNVSEYATNDKDNTIAIATGFAKSLLERGGWQSKKQLLNEWMKCKLNSFAVIHSSAAEECSCTDSTWVPPTSGFYLRIFGPPTRQVLKPNSGMIRSANQILTFWGRTRDTQLWLFHIFRLASLDLKSGHVLALLTKLLVSRKFLTGVCSLHKVSKAFSARARRVTQCPQITLEDIILITKFQWKRADFRWN